MSRSSRGPFARLEDADGAPPAGDRIAERIRAMIIDGTLAAEDRLPGEQELASRFGVSRPTLREALKRLAAQSLIRTKRGASGGSFVSRPEWRTARESLSGTVTLLVAMTPVEAAAVAEARLALLSGIAPLAVARAGDEDIAAMQAAIAMERASSTSDEAFCAADIAFHHAFADASGNAFLALQLAGVLDAIQPLLNRLTFHLRDRRQTAARHERIVTAVQARDAAAAVAEFEAASAETAKLLAEAQAVRAARHREGER